MSSPKIPAPPAKPLTEAEKIWQEIKDLTIDVFGLGGQTIKDYVVGAPAVIEPTKCYLVLKVPAALPALETAVGKKFVVAASNKFISVARVPEEEVVK